MGIFKQLDDLSYYDEDGVEVISLKDAFFNIKREHDEIMKVLSSTEDAEVKLNKIKQIITNGRQK